MNIFETINTHVLNWLPFSISVIIGVLVIVLFYRFIEYQTRSSSGGNKVYYQLALFFIFNIFLIILIINTPFSESLKGQLLSLLGITFTAAVALSSTTFLGNIMAGLMIKSLGKFKPGDFLSIENNFGRVTELGLLHTEIQTQDRDLTTLPNLYLVSNPVKVIRSSGTIISQEVSLGYDIHHNKIEKALLEAARKCGLDEPFMHIQSLGDFSVVYKIYGFLTDIKSILSMKAKLREEILDSCHAHQIEIVSPNFMNQRVINPSHKFIPKYEKDVRETHEKVEDIAFDKAEEAESIEKIKEKIGDINIQITSVKEDKDISDDDRQVKVKHLKAKSKRLQELVKKSISSEES